MQTTEPRDTVVIGGGMAGLAAAAYAARAGMRVQLFERAGEPGGRATTQEKDGFLLNLGPHAIYKGAPGLPILRELGVEFSGDYPNTAGKVYHGGRVYQLPAGATSLVTSRYFGLRDRAAFAAWFAGLRHLDTVALDSVPLDAWLGEHLSGRARLLAEALLRVANYANAPADQSAGAALDRVRRAFSGVIYVDGGWRVLVDGLRAAAERAGATITTGSRVTGIRPAGNGWEVGFADGGTVAARTVIIAAGPADVRDLAGAFVPGAGRWAERAVPLRAACLDIGVRRLPRPKTTFAIGTDQPFYYSVHTKAAKLAPEGHHLISMARYLRPGEREDPDATLEELERMLDALQPGWRPQEVVRRFLPNLLVSHSAVTAAEGGLPGRPGPAVPGAPGLFIAGDWVGPEGMISDAALASGRAAAGLAAEAVRSPARALVAAR